MMKNIDNEFKLDVKDEIHGEECDDEYDSESDLEDDRDFVQNV